MTAGFAAGLGFSTGLVAGIVLCFVVIRCVLRVPHG